MRHLLISAVVLAATAVPAAAAPGLLVGVTEDGLKYEPAATVRDARALGLDAIRITLSWAPGRTRPTAEQRLHLDAATRGARDLRIVLSVFGERAAFAPVTAERRDDYCEYVRGIVARYPTLRDIVIWNEPSKAFFWHPQFDERGQSAAPAAYAGLLARCWDVLHAQRRNVNVLAPSTAPRGNDRPDAISNVSHSPVRFLEELGAAYRASGRDRPLFDSVAHHVHGVTSAEPPWQAHPGRSVSQGDYARLVATLRRAFAGTLQPVPGRCVQGRCAPIWYLEGGFQTTVDGRKRSRYTGKEVVTTGIPDVAAAASGTPDQATQLTAALQLAYCQPYVEAFFNFLLWDEARLEGWQSGLFWADRTAKGSAPAFRAVLRDVRAGRIECARLRQQLPQPAAALGTPISVKPDPVTPTHASSVSTPSVPADTTSTASTTGSAGSTVSPVPAATDSDDDDDGLDAALVAAGAGALAILGAAGIALARRRSRPRRNSG